LAIYKDDRPYLPTESKITEASTAIFPLPLLPTTDKNKTYDLQVEFDLPAMKRQKIEMTADFHSGSAADAEVSGARE
jgi:hypothetical protein